MAAGDTAGMLVPLGREGTGAATVLKNELIPALANEQRRQDRLWQADQAAKREAAKLKAKQEAEDAKYVPEFESTKGGYLSKQNQDLANQDIQSLLEARKAGVFKSTPEYHQAVNLVKNKIQNRGALHDFSTVKMDETIKKLSDSGYDVGPADAIIYGQEQPTAPNVLEIPHAERFRAKIESDPERFKWREKGANLFKTVGTDNYSFTNSLGQSVLLDRSKLFIPVKVKDPVSGEIVTTQGINGELAMQAIEGDPVVKKAMTNAVDLDVAAALRNPANTKTKDDLIAESTDRYTKRLFQGMGNVVYKKDIQTEESKAKQKASGEKLADLNVGAPQVSARVITTKDGREIKAMIQGAVPMWNSKKSLPLPAGITFHPMGVYEDPGEMTSRKLQGTEERVLRANIETPYVERVTGIPTANRDIVVFDKVKNVRYPVKAGEVIADAINNPSLLEGLKNMYTLKNGYLAAPDESQLEKVVDPNNDEVSYKRKNPKSTSLVGHIFIEDASAGSLKTIFNKAGGGSKKVKF